MLLRRTTTLAIALAAFACAPSVPYDPANNNPTAIDYAGFDPTGSPPDIPLPNDLALQPQAIASVAAQSPAQAALLTIWAGQGFPNDQEVPITINFVQVKIDPDTGAQTRVAPQLDTSSINQLNLIVLSASLSGAGSGAVAYDPPKPTDYAVVGDHGTLTIHKTADPNNGGSRRWPPNSEIIVAARGGANGIKVTGGSAGGLQPQAAMYLLLQDKDLTLPENQPLLPGNTRAEKAATGAQLEALRKNYLVPFAAIDQVWGANAHREIGTMGTFRVADTAKRAHVETDASGSGSGVPVPFPSQFMFDSTGHLSKDAQPAFGPLGPPLATLDGFSTTAMMLAGTSSPVQAGSIATGVYIFEVNTGATPPFRRLKEIGESIAGGTPTAAEYAAEPTAVTEDVTTGKACTTVPYTAACVSTVIGLQPAVPAAIPVAPGFVPLPPLKENTTYVVLVADKVKDLNGDPLTRSTLGNILLLDPSIPVAVGGHSTVSGVSDAQAVGIDQMRVAINGAAQVLAADPIGVSRDHLVMGYTFKTQSFKNTATQLAALPYGAPISTVQPVAPTKFYGAAVGSCYDSTPAPIACPDGVVTDVFNKYGVDTTLVPSTHIQTIVEAEIVTFNALNPANGAFLDLTNPANQPAAEPITALIALPLCGAPPCKVPLAIFRHGFGGGRGAMLPMADALLAQGIAVAAIDAAKQGDRSFCKADSECASGTCQPIPALAGQGDTGATPGACMNGTTPTDFVRRPVLCPSTGCATATNTEGIPIASSNFVISANFFRSRDTFRQDIIDQSQLIRVLSPDPTNPTCLADTAHPNGCANAIFTAKTLIEIDPTKIFYVGHSLGAFNGTADVAANPRVSKAVFASGGGTIVDTFTNSPSFASSVGALLAGLGITPGTAGYLQFVNVAKWIIDPADPLNYADNLSHTTLASPLSGGVAPPARAVLSQASNCDITVPNPFNLELHGLDVTAANGPSALTVLTHVNTGSGQPDYTSVGLAGTATSCGVPAGGSVVAVPEAVAHGGAVPHSIFTDFGCLYPPSSATCTVNPNLTPLTTAVQSDAAAFFASGTIPPASRNAQ